MIHSFDYTGKLLRSGRYRLEQCIGRSKMSYVYRGTDVLLRRPVAVKILNDHLDNEFLLRFRREAHIMARLDHAHIVSVYDYGNEGGLTYLVMPYLSEGTLQNDLEQNGSFTLLAACPYIEQIAAALDYAHAFHIIHRDLKPANLLFHPDGRLLLTDFGIARVRRSDATSPWSTLTGEGMLIGTPGYIAPENILGKPIDHRADIYALGIILYQMLSGEIPFRGDTYAVLIQQLHGTLPSLHASNPALPSAVDCIIRKATALEPEQRYASAGALAQALRRVANRQIVPSAPMPAPATVPAYEVPVSPFATLELPVAEASSAAGSPPSMSQKGQVPSAPSRKNAASFTFVLALLLTTLLILTLISIGLALSPQSIQLKIGGSLTNTVTLTPAPTLLAQEGQAKAAVLDYYRNWNNHDYQEAYDQLDPTYQEHYPYSSLLHSYEDTAYSTVYIISAILLADGSWKVAITDYAIERDPSTAQVFRKVYRGYFIVKKEHDVWKLTPYFQYAKGA